MVAPSGSSGRSSRCRPGAARPTKASRPRTRRGDDRGGRPRGTARAHEGPGSRPRRGYRLRVPAAQPHATSRGSPASSPRWPRRRRRKLPRPGRTPADETRGPTGASPRRSQRVARCSRTDSLARDWDARHQAVRVLAGARRPVDERDHADRVEHVAASESMRSRHGGVG